MRVEPITALIMTAENDLEYQKLQKLNKMQPQNTFLCQPCQALTLFVGPGDGHALPENLKHQEECTERS